MPDTDPARGRWSPQRAHAWSQARPWICGFNYLPSSAVNFLEMWRAETFDPQAIDRELGWAADIGMNAMRTNPQFLVWKHDRAGFFERLDRVLEIAASHDLATVLCPFDDCGFSGVEPHWGPQPDPIPGTHNSRAVGCPGRAALMDRRQWPDLESYLRDIVARHASDPRILFWDLYNEPTSRVLFLPSGFAETDDAHVSLSHELMCSSFAWAREIGPDQPLTVGPWIVPPPGSDLHPYQTPCERDALALSDIITFHAYVPADRLSLILDELETHDRPIVATEWMARGVDSRIRDQLPLLRERDVGSMTWGLIKGRSQTELPWPQVRTDPAYAESIASGEWFHDLFHTDGRPYDPDEIETIRLLTGRTGSSRLGSAL